MTDDRPPVLEELDGLAIGPAPVGEILHAGHTAKRRRRTVLASVAAVAALLVGVGVVTTQVVGGSDDRDSLVADDTGTNAPQSNDLIVVVEPFNPEPSLSGIASSLAHWNPETQVLDYTSRLGYSSTCPPQGLVSLDGGAVDLVLAAPVTNDEPCTADDRPMIATITGLTEAPAEFTVTESGETRKVIVTAFNLELPCSEAQRRGTDLDVPGPGQPTPEQAVAPYANGTTIREELPNSVVVHELNDDGDVTRTYLVSKHDDGWWPDGWLECA